MVDIVTQNEMWEQAEDFTSAINKIKANPEDFQNGDKVVLIDWENKQTMFLKVTIGVQEY